MSSLRATLRSLLDDPPLAGQRAGARRGADGQVLVCNDLLGFDTSFKPRFVKRFAELETPMIEAVSAYAAEVRAGTFPAAEHSFFRRKGPRKVAKIY